MCRLAKHRPVVCASLRNAGARFSGLRRMVPNVQRSLEWYLRLTDMQRQTYREPDGGPILRVGSGPHFVALVEGRGPAAFRPHVGFGVQGFAPDQVMKTLAEHGVSART